MDEQKLKTLYDLLKQRNEIDEQLRPLLGQNGEAPTKRKWTRRTAEDPPDQLPAIELNGQ
jgi:hypothetical protein